MDDTNRCLRKCNPVVTVFHGTMPSVPSRPPLSARLAPALGLAAACVLLGVVGAYAIDTADNPRQPSGFAGAIPLASGSQSSALGAAAPTTTAAATSSRPVIAVAPTGSAPPAGGESAGIQSGQSVHARQSASSIDYALAVFGAMNRGRAAQHLPALVWDARLQQSAHGHNRAMASSNTLAHQVAAEPALGARESSAGVRWTYAAENIGWTTQRSLAGVLDIEARMLTETAPNDAHRRNILSRQAQTVGIDVYYDAAHSRLWLTEDFSGT
jgi:uncharacterized protein YkwD